MKTRLAYFLVLLFSTLGAISCSDDDKGLTIYKDVGSSIDGAVYQKVKNHTTTVGGFALFAKGGTGEYYATADDESIVKFINQHNGHGEEYIVLEFKSLKVGTTKVTISDGESSADVTVTVGERSRYVSVSSVETQISGSNISTEFSEAIEIELLKDMEVEPKGHFNLVFNTSETGTVELFPNSNSKEPTRKGTFAMVRETDSYYYIFTYTDKTVKYQRMQPEAEGRALGSQMEIWYEDLTSNYREKYPNATIENVSYKLTVGISR